MRVVRVVRVYHVLRFFPCVDVQHVLDGGCGGYEKSGRCGCEKKIDGGSTDGRMWMTNKSRRTLEQQQQQQQ